MNAGAINLIGIYKIVNNVNGKIYVGSSKNIYGRFKEHKWYLDNKRHVNENLQTAWDKFGEHNFTFEVLEQCEIVDLLIKEDYWINHYSSNNEKFGYNIYCADRHKSRPIKSRLKISNAQIGIKNHMYGKKFSQERRNKISVKYSGTGNPFYGKHHKESTKRILSEIGKKLNQGTGNGNSKLSKEIVFEIYDKLINGLSVKNTCELYKISETLARNIKAREHWAFREVVEH
jgi:group I intron endonuclease